MPDVTHLVEVVPPRDLAGSAVAARGMLRALAGTEVTLEIAVDDRGPRWYLRAGERPALGHALAELRAAYPQAAVEPVPAGRPDLDPAHALAGERAAAVELLPADEPALPLRAAWEGEADPLSGLLAGAAPEPGERVVLRLALGPPRAGAAGRIRSRAAPALPPRREAPAPRGPSLLPVVGVLLVAAGALQARIWHAAGEWGLLYAGGAAVALAVAAGGVLAARLRRRPDPLPPRLVERKLASPLLSAGLEVKAVGPGEADPGRLLRLASRAASAYAAYDGPEGAGLRPSPPRRSRRRRARPPLLLNADEAAALWHLPDEEGAPAGVRRTTARRLPPRPGHAVRGARVGHTDAGGTEAPVRMPAALLHRNQLIVAKTRRGKSTLLRHLASAVMEGVGPEEAALVVVDPHRDLAEAVLASVPPRLAGSTTYLDFANPSRPVGLNLLDRGLFPDRDRTTEHVVTMMNRLWPQNWGPRMEGALRASLLTLLEANGERAREEQYTLLDVAPLLTDRELRSDLLERVRDPAVRAWWRDNYDRVGRVLQQQTATPVTSKIGRFTVTEASRLVLGQAASTFDPREVLTEGGVLVVNTATGALGEGASGLVGATLLNLLGLLVEEQVQLPAERRRRVVCLVDESSTLGAVDYPRMLSELGKYGASFVLVTQSLSKLDAVDRQLAPTLFANIDGLTAFGVSAEDARRLVPELGGGIEIEDLVSLDDFACYARWWDGRGRPPAFSFRVDPPPALEPGRAAAIAVRSQERVGRPRELVQREVERALEARLPGRPERPARGGAGKSPQPGDAGDGRVDPPARPPRRAGPQRRSVPQRGGGGPPEAPA